MVRLVPGGPPLLAIAIDRVRGLTDDLFLVGVPRPGYDQLEVPVITDHQPELGPLGGIATALRHAKYPACLVVACDMPFLNQALLAHMAALPRSTYDVLVPEIPRDLSTPDGPIVEQPLHAIYQRSCLPAITAQLATTERRVSAFYDAVRVQVISAEQVRQFDPRLRSFFNINTPAAAEQARSWVAGSSPSR
jgi:molybdopterin-guanine dinucleotide biosynthesis protein A